MRDAFVQWLQRQPVTARTRSTKTSDTRRLANHYGDLDAAYDADGLEAIRASLNYSTEDKRAGRANPSKLVIDGDLYNNLASYRSALALYARFRLTEARDALPGHGLNAAELDRLKRLFLEHYPDFESLTFAANRGGYWDQERSYKEEVMAKAAPLLVREGDSDEAVGLEMLRVMVDDPANFLGWRSVSNIRHLTPETAPPIARAIGQMLRDPDDAAAVAGACAARIHPLMTGGELRTVVTTALALARPGEAVAVKTRYLQRAALALTGRRVFRAEVLTAEEYRELLSLTETLFAIMRDDWGWAPRDLWDVQGFLWMTDIDQQAGGLREDDEEGAPPLESTPQPPARKGPTNLILHGPPGVGKTYETAARAVALCDGDDVPRDRAALMARYRELMEGGRISFVTFHQSYAYEDFVEGLRPVTGDGDAAEGGDGKAAAQAGFSLRAEPGVFRRIAELARDNRGRAVAAPPALGRERQVFKMSLGRSDQEEGARIFNQAYDGGYVVLGWGGEVDWSAGAYDQYAAIKARWLEVEPHATSNNPNIQQISTLRAGMRVGDLVIISDGNRRFRAIGEIIGPYQFRLDALREYNHRRPVRWLWRSDEGQPVDVVYQRYFSQVSAYQLDSRAIKWPALEQLIAGGGEAAATDGEPEAYVLIIDEINRANISKVFGELITLIEPDKRLGQLNGLTVTLPYSRQSFGVPANLHLIGAMNTADRSIALLDTALRRRFEFEELMPRPDLLAIVDGVDLREVLKGLNARIEYLFDRDHQIGHAFFIGCRTLADANAVMRGKVIPLLVEYFYEDWEKVRLVLGETTEAGAFVSRTPLAPPRGAESFGSDESRWRYAVRADFTAEAYGQLLG